MSLVEATASALWIACARTPLKLWICAPPACVLVWTFELRMPGGQRLSDVESGGRTVDCAQPNYTDEIQLWAAGMTGICLSGRFPPCQLRSCGLLS